MTWLHAASAGHAGLMLLAAMVGGVIGFAFGLACMLSSAAAAEARGFQRGLAIRGDLDANRALLGEAS